MPGAPCPAAADRACLRCMCNSGCEQEIATKGEVAAQRAKEASSHRKEFIAERCNAARDHRTLRNRGACTLLGCWGARYTCGAKPGLVLSFLSCPPEPLLSSRLPCRAGVLRVHERLARERNKAKDDDRAMRLEALKARPGPAGAAGCRRREERRGPARWPLPWAIRTIPLATQSLAATPHSLNTPHHPTTPPSTPTGPRL